MLHCLHISGLFRASENLNVLARKSFFQKFNRRGKQASTYVGACMHNLPLNTYDLMGILERNLYFALFRCVSGDELKKMVGVMTEQVRLRTAETYGQHMLPRYLQLGLGGEEYFASAIVTKEGLCIGMYMC